MCVWAHMHLCVWKHEKTKHWYSGTYKGDTAMDPALSLLIALLTRSRRNTKLGHINQVVKMS